MPKNLNQFNFVGLVQVLLELIRAFIISQSININGFVLLLFYTERTALERREIELR